MIRNLPPHITNAAELQAYLDTLDPEARQAEIERLRRLFAGVLERATAMSNALRQFAEAVLEAVQPAVATCYEVFHEAYIEQGAPYGDTPEGCGRWLGEQDE